MNKDIKQSLVWAGGLIGLALAASAARRFAYIDAEATNRILLIAIGLMVAWYGNRAPKAFLPSARARQANRVAGWSMALSGVAYAALWAFAPTEVALTVGCGAILAGIAVSLLYCLSLRGKPGPA